MKTKLIGVIAAVMLVGVYPVQGDLVFDSGHNTFDDSYPYYNEVGVINDAHLDVLGGAAWKLELVHYATANIYDGDIEWLVTRDNTVVNIYDEALDLFGAWDNSLVYLYAYNVKFHPVDEYGKSWIEGKYCKSDIPFTLKIWHKDQYSHVTIIPEPSSLIMLMFGSLLLKRRR